MAWCRDDGASSPGSPYRGDPCEKHADRLPGFESSILPAHVVGPPAAPRRVARRRVLSGVLLLGVLLLDVRLVASRSQIAATLDPVARARPHPFPATPRPMPVATPVLPGYASLDLDVPAGGSYRLTFPRWPAGTVFEGSVVLGADGVGFRLQKPDGGELINLPRIQARYAFHATAPEAGQYALIFDNHGAPAGGRRLTLRYRAYVPVAS